MPPGPPWNRRVLTLLSAALALVFIILIAFSRHNGSGVVYSNAPIHKVSVADSTLHGGPIMGKLGNETIKTELGRAAWKLLHTTMARFPDTPTDDDQTALFSYVHLFARLYPCGECAGHFRQILQKFPPQVKTRSSAAAWACHVHNEVNKSLKKPIFDCSNVGDFYDCGCAENEDGRKTASEETSVKSTTELELEKERKTLEG